MKCIKEPVIAAALAAASAAGLLALRASGVVVSLTSAKDNTLVESATGSLSNGAGDGFFAGTTAQSPGFNKRRGLVAFDLAALPSNAVLNAVSVTLTSVKAQSVSNVSLHLAQKGWGEGTSDAGPTGGGGTTSAPGDATWIHTFYSNQFWTNAGGDFAVTPSATASMGFGPATFASAQLTADVSGWLTNPAANFGWEVLGVESTIATAKRIATHESFEEDARPKLTIDYSASTWKTSAGTWSSAANWNFGVPNAAGAEANFTLVLADPAAVVAVTIDTPKTAGSLNFDSPNAHTLSGSQLTLDRAAGRNALNVVRGSQHIAAAVQLAKDTDVTVAGGAALGVTGTLSVAGGVMIHKLGDGALAVNNIRAGGLDVAGGKVAIAPNG